MLSLHKKKRIVAAVVAVIAIVPAVGFAISKMTNMNDASAWQVSFNNQLFGECVKTAFRAEYPGESISYSGLKEEQIARVRSVDCDFTDQGWTTHNSSTILDDIDDDLAMMTNLEVLKITGWETLTHANLSHNSNLKTIYIPGEKLDNINLSANTKLESADLNGNQLTSVSLPAGSKLTYLDVSNNKLSSMDTSRLTGLVTLKAQKNSLTYLNLKNSSALTTLMADNINLDVTMPNSKTEAGDVFDISNLKFIGSNNTINNTDRYTYSSATKKVTVTSLSGSHGREIQVNSTNSYYKYKLNIPVYTLSSELPGWDNPSRSWCVPLNGECTLKANDIAPVLEGYVFKNWIDEETGQTYELGEEVTLTRDVMLNAEWDRRLTFWLTFDYMGGDTRYFEDYNYSCDTTASVKSCEVTLPTLAPGRSGYEFLGWMNSASGTSANYGVGDTVTLTDHKTIYALWQWANPTYTLSFDMNGGEGEVEEQNCTVLEEGGSCTVTVPVAVPEREGFDFLGWANSNNASAKQYEANNEIALTGNKTLYAVWEERWVPPTYTLSFDVNGGIGTVVAQTCSPVNPDSGCSVQIPEADLERSGYRFLGWSDTAGVTVQDYVARDMVGLNGDKTIYAVWEEIVVYTMTAHSAQGDVELIRCTVEHGANSCKGTITRMETRGDGWQFAGWNENANADTGAYHTGDEVELNSNKTVYEIWLEKYYLMLFVQYPGEEAVEYNNRDCMPESANGTCSVILPSAGPEREGYTYFGLMHDADGKQAEYTGGETFTFIAGQHEVWLYALMGSGEVTWIQGQERIRGDGVDAKLRIDYPRANVASVKIDGSAVSEGITMETGSTILTINDEYLDTLEAGEHELVVDYGGERVISTTFVLNEQEKEEEEEEEEEKEKEKEKEEKKEEKKDDEKEENEEDDEEETGAELLVPNTGDNTGIGGGSVMIASCVGLGAGLIVAGGVALRHKKKINFETK